MDWDVSKPSFDCSSCGKRLEDMEFFSALRDNGADFERLDFCGACFDAASKDAFFSYWKTRHQREEKTRSRPRFIDTDAMLDIFRKLSREGNAGKEVFTFLLGMVLVQKRVLRYVRSESREDRDFVALSHAKSGESFLVLNPPLGEEEMRKAKENFDAILDTQSE